MTLELPKGRVYGEASAFTWPPATTRAPLGPLDPDADGCICHHDLPINALAIIAARPGDGTTWFRRFVRGNWFGHTVPGVPFVPGADSNAPQTMSWFLFKYAAEWQAVILSSYRAKGYLDYLLMYANARDEGGLSDDQFFALCQQVVDAGLRLVVSWGSKGLDPQDDTADGWPARALPMLERLIAAQLIDKAIVGFEMDLWNRPDHIDAIIRRFAAVCTPAGVYLYTHWSPNHDDWPLPGVTRQQWWTSMKGLLRGEMYQNDGRQSVALMQARLDEMLVIFAAIGPADDVGYFDHVAAEAVGEQELYGMTEDRGDTINYQLLCTPATAQGTGPCCVMGSAGGFRHPDGRIL